MVILSAALHALGTSRYPIHRFGPTAMRECHPPRGLTVSQWRSPHALDFDLAVFLLVCVPRNPHEHRRTSRFCFPHAGIETLPRCGVDPGRAVCVAASSYLAF